MEKITDISIYTSIYRGEAHFPQYINAVLNVGRILHNEGIQLEIVLIANDATDAERAFIDDLTTQSTSIFSITPLFVEREPLYTSWNRGIEAASGTALCPWNIDDIRTVEGLIDGYRLIQNGCDLVDFPYTFVHHDRFGTRTKQRPALYKPERIHRKTHLGTFFMFSRELYNQAGGFDTNFRIAGDFEWGARSALRQCNYCKSDVIAGEFHEHGSNLSGRSASEDVINVLETLETDIVFLRHQIWDMAQLRPVPDHQALREAWETWGNPGDMRVPDDVAAKLWGDQAEAYWQQWKADYVKRQRDEQIRRIPRAIVDATGLRPLLARFGIVKRG